MVSDKLSGEGNRELGRHGHAAVRRWRARDRGLGRRARRARPAPRRPHWSRSTSPPQWGSPEIVRERLGEAVTALTFDRGTMRAPGLSVQHLRTFFETSVGPVMRIVQTLSSDPSKLAEFHREFDALLTEYFEPTENILRQDYLFTRATKR